MRKILISFAAIATLIVVGCSGTATHATDALGSTAGRSERSTDTAESKVATGSFATEAPLASSSSVTPTTVPAPAVNVADATSTKQIKTGTISLTAAADRVAAVANQAAGTATTAGGSVDERRDTAGRHATSDLVLKVPPDQIHPVMVQLGKLAKVRSSNEQTEDVTGQYADMDGRLTTLRISVARLQGFLNKATDANQITQLEGELTQRESDLESMQSQLDTLSVRVQMATIHVSITTRNAPPAPKPKPRHDPPSPASALARGWTSLTRGARWTLAGLAISLPYLVLAALVALFGVRLVRRSSGRRAQVA